MLQFRAPVKSWEYAVTEFEHLTYDLCVISGVGGGADPDFDVIDTPLVGPDEPLFSSVCLAHHPGKLVVTAVMGKIVLLANRGVRSQHHVPGRVHAGGLQ